MEVIRMKTHAATCQPRFRAHTRTGVPLENPQNSDVKHQVNHSKRCKGDVRERIIDLSLGSPNRNKSYLRKLAHARSSLCKIPGLGNSGTARKIKRSISNVKRKLQFLWSVTGFLQTTLSVTCFRPPSITLQAFVQTNGYKSYLVCLVCAFSEITPSRCHVLRPCVCEAPSHRPTFPSEMCRAFDE